MNTSRSANLIAAERRRRIYEQALERGSVSVSELVKELGVTENTIRHDLDLLQEEGKLLRSHGGAVIEDWSQPSLPYAQTRGEHITEKSLIAAVASRYLPDSGSIYINAGSTTHQLALQVPKNNQLHIATNSPEIALYLARNTDSDIDLFGGKLVAASEETDGTLANDALERLYWDVSFFGISGIDLRHGITSINLNVALFEGRVMEHSSTVIGLCDSSKLGRFSHARVGPVGLIDVLITDSDADPIMLEAVRVQGVEVVVAEQVTSNHTEE